MPILHKNPNGQKIRSAKLNTTNAEATWSPKTGIRLSDHSIRIPIDRELEWGLRQEFSTSATVALNIHRAHTSIARFDLTPENPRYHLIPSYSGSIELGHTRGAELAQSLTEMLLEPTEISALPSDQIIKAMGFKAEETLEQDGVNIFIYVKQVSPRNDTVSLCLSDRFIDLDYQSSPSTSWFNLLRIQRLQFPDLDHGDFFRPIATCLKKINLSIENLLRIVQSLIALIETDGPPRRLIKA